MGLPLFVAPVESDIPSKPATKSPADPAHSRSPIRRADRRRQLNETREHRLRLLAALQGNESSLNLPQSRNTERFPTDDLLRPVRSTPLSDSSMPPGLGLDPSIDRPLIFLRREESIESRDSPRPERQVIRDFSPMLEESYLRNDGRNVSWNDLSYTNPPSIPRLRSSRDLAHANRTSSVGRYRMPRRSSPDAIPGTRPSRPRGPDPGEYLNEYRRRRNMQMHPGAPRGFRPVRYADGLGDRDRSLSPEGDGVWDILQSTLTPDPQPPSVGSSFASTTASAAASQSTTSSSNTTITNPDEEAEPPCDPVGENSDAEGEGDEDAERRTEPSRLPTPHGHRLYADVAAEELPGLVPASRDEDPDRLEWLSDMQRIVRGLASHQDIPDEWWAAAGLNRSTAWDESN